MTRHRDQSDKLIDQSFSILDAIKASEERIQAVLKQKQERPRRVQIRLQALETLQFPEMSSRYYSIANAYSETFDWALKDDTSSLKTWLLHGSDLFWICGKAGSGKSTFMKFLRGDERTWELLETWAGGSDNLILVNCYFWYLGTELEKSIDGLLRTILHQILDVHELISGPMEACLDRQGTGPWTQTALKELIQLAILNAAPRKVCIFIDGLDEYKGNHTSLVTFLNELNLQTGAKLCVSSRPWNVFTRAYEEDKPHLYLQDLTRSDIEHYVTSTLTSAATAATTDDPDMTAEALLDITRDVIQKADGVFLWVALVTQSVLTGLAEGDHILTLRQRVLEFPADLGTFFKCILDRIEPVYRNQTVQCLLLACLYLDGHNAKAAAMSSFMDFWFIRQAPTGLESMDYFYQLKARSISYKEFITMESQTRRFLSSCCKDLLHVLPRQGQRFNARGPPGSSRTTFMGILPKHDEQRDIMPGPGPKVQFLHRTVYDFIQETGERMSLEQKAPPSFKNGDVLHMINLGRLKLYPKCGTQYYPKRGNCARHGLDSCMICDVITGTDDRLAYDRALHDGASFSLQSSWPGLGEKFVEQLRTIYLLRQHGSAFSSLKVPLAVTGIKA